MVADDLSQAGGRDAQAAEGGDAAIDVQRLADLVYRLMVAEVRLGLARGETWSESASSGLQ